MPVTAFTISVGAIATVGVPLFNIFWSKIRIILATLSVGYTWAAALVLAASVVEAVYYFRLLHVIWFEGTGERMHENMAMGIMLLFLAALVIVIGGSIQATPGTSPRRLETTSSTSPSTLRTYH